MVMRFAQSGAAIVALLMGSQAASAQSLTESLALAYSNNPTLNSARSVGRATDEGVGIAISGYRPQISASGSYGFESRSGSINRDSRPASISLNLVQPIFNGFQTVNRVQSSEASVRAQRESLRNTEQTVLLDAATAFVDVIRDTSVAALRETDVKFFVEQVRAAKDRFNVGEGTKTDVAQAEARLQQSISQLNFAKANVSSARATYRQVVGVEPAKLTGSYPIERFIPKSIDLALSTSQNEHPAIKASVHNIDVASFNLKVVEAELLPTLNLQGSVSRSWDQSVPVLNQAQIGLNVTVPIYQGGAEYARIRQSKEQLGTARIQSDVNRDQVRAAVVSNWGQLESSTASITAAKAQVAAAQLALEGVIEEQRVGQRTTLDVLNAQTDLTTAQITLIQAERNRIVAAFSLTASIGRLDSDNLRLPAVKYRPQEHYEQVRDLWIGLRTPDGR